MAGVKTYGVFCAHRLVLLIAVVGLGWGPLTFVDQDEVVYLPAADDPFPRQITLRGAAAVQHDGALPTQSQQLGLELHWGPPAVGAVEAQRPVLEPYGCSGPAAPYIPVIN